MNAAPPIVLEPAESVLWSGAPHPGSVLVAAWRRARMRIVIAGGLALLFALAAIRGAEGDGVVFASLAGLAASAGVLFALWPIIPCIKAQRTSYAVTTHRLVIREGTPAPRLRTFAREDLVPLRVHRASNGRGDVFFACDVQMIGHPSCGCGAGLCPTPSGKVARVTEVLDRRIEAPIGFRAIPDPDSIAALISERFGIPRAADGSPASS